MYIQVKNSNRPLSFYYFSSMLLAISWFSLKPEVGECVRAQFEVTDRQNVSGLNLKSQIGECVRAQFEVTDR